MSCLPNAHVFHVLLHRVHIKCTVFSERVKSTILMAADLGNGSYVASNRWVRPAGPGRKRALNLPDHLHFCCGRGIRLNYRCAMASTRSVTVDTDATMRNILIFRGQKVLLDSDLAGLYQVETKTLSRAVRRNLVRFPADFMFQLAVEEAASLRSQSGALKTGRGKHGNMCRTFLRSRESPCRPPFSEVNAPSK